MDRQPQKILLQTTIPATEDDWSIARFSRLGRLLRDQNDDEGRPLYDVTMRDRDALGAPDTVLSGLAESAFGQMWLFAVDVGDGLTSAECDSISRFRLRGGGLMVTRDHMDLGSSICSLGGVGAAHHFHTRNVDPVVEAQGNDDPFTRNISWPNFHSGANGDFQEIEVIGPVHTLLSDPASPTGAIRFLPSHPHEGAVSAPANADARVIAAGKSKTTGRRFNLSVAFERGSNGGPAVAQSTFHHFADYNWDVRSGAPSFVSEQPGEGMSTTPQATADAHRYALNIARWLSNADNSC